MLLAKQETVDKISGDTYNYTTRKWTQIGHTLRMHEDDIPKHAEDYQLARGIGDMEKKEK